MRALGIARPAPLRLDWSRDPATGAPVACWVLDDGELVWRYLLLRRIFRLAARQGGLNLLTLLAALLPPWYIKRKGWLR